MSTEKCTPKGRKMRKLAFLFLTITAILAGCNGKSEKEIYWKNDHVEKIYTHTVGQGVPVVLIGNGFDREDLKKGGYWETVARGLVDTFFFDVPIVKQLKDYFDVYVYMAESEERGVAPETKNRFGNVGPDGINYEMAVELIKKAPGMPEKFSTIFVGNGMIGGFAWFELRMGVYSTDEKPSIYWMAHEFVGHAFGGLGDEYGGPGTYMSLDDLRQLQTEEGKSLNVSATNDLTQVPWKDFVGLPGYEEVGAFEGGFYHDKGVWRPEVHSLMVGWKGEPYFNAMSRWILYREIMEQAKVPYSFNKFLEFDKQFNTK
jgi:hypothetical protein